MIRSQLSWLLVSFSAEPQLHMQNVSKNRIPFAATTPEQNVDFFSRNENHFNIFDLEKKGNESSILSSELTAVKKPNNSISTYTHKKSYTLNGLQTISFTLVDYAFPFIMVQLIIHFNVNRINCSSEYKKNVYYSTFFLWKKIIRYILMLHNFNVMYTILCIVCM